MPSKSPKQAKLMRAVAHGWKKPGGGGPTRAVAKEFMKADMRRSGVKGYQAGGYARGVPGMRRMPTGYAKPQGALSRDPRAMPPMPYGGGTPGMPPGGAVMPPRRGGPYGGGGRRGMPPQRGQMPWRGAPPPRVQPGGGRFRQGPMAGRRMGPGRQDPRAMPPTMRGALDQYKSGAGRRVAPPPNKYPGGGNPFMGGRNPMMRTARQFGPGRTMRR